MQTVADLCRNLRSGLTPCPPLHKCGEGELRTPLSSPLSAWRRGGQGVRTEGRGDQRGEDEDRREVVILSARAARARAKDLLAVGPHEKQVLRIRGKADPYSTLK